MLSWVRWWCWWQKPADYKWSLFSLPRDDKVLLVWPSSAVVCVSVCVCVCVCVCRSHPLTTYWTVVSTQIVWSASVQFFGQASVLRSVRYGRSCCSFYYIAAITLHAHTHTHRQTQPPPKRTITKPVHPVNRILSTSSNVIFLTGWSAVSVLSTFVNQNDKTEPRRYFNILRQPARLSGRNTPNHGALRLYQKQIFILRENVLFLRI